MRRDKLWYVLGVLLVAGLVIFKLYPAMDFADEAPQEIEASPDEEASEPIIIELEDEAEIPADSEEDALEPEGEQEEGREDESSPDAEDTVQTLEEEKLTLAGPDFNEDGFEVLKHYDASLPEGLTLELAYDDYWINTHYIVVLSGSVNIRQGPSTEYEVIKRGYYGQKFSLSETVRGQYFDKSSTNEWHRIFWWENGEMVYGYVYAPIVTAREFRFEEMLRSASDLKLAVDATDTGYIYNVGDSNGRAPLYKGAYSEDDYAVPRYQGAPAYFAPDWNSYNMRYMQDGILFAILEETDKFYKVNAYDYEGEFYVPKRYVSKRNAPENLRQVIVVDIENQNEGVFEYREDTWYLISYSYATTGADTKYKEPTIPGSYQIINKQDYFRYRDDITKELAGYAPYALRFNGGAFIHGVPVNYKIVKETVVIQEELLDEEGNIVQERITEQRVVDRIDPGHIEYMGSLGTIPLSHKCVRNITSHAEFLHDWVVLGEASVVVID
jgi:lipoprotein-anchoring transpeptidase ErfK/SrfK